MLKDLNALYVIIGLIIVVAIYFIYVYWKRQAALQRYVDLKIGMSESRMLLIMGNDLEYNVSQLKDNRKKYEWRINARSTTYYSHGIASTDYTGVKKLDVYLKDGCIEEIRPYNI